MNIYDLKISDLRQIMRQFGATLYGRTVFLIAYFVPITLFFVLVGLSIATIAAPNVWLIVFSASALLAFITSFMIANAYYYRELRVYVEHFRNSDHARIKKYFN